MSEVPNKESSRHSASLHFQILLVGTVIFVAALFWLADFPHANTPNEASMIVLRIFDVVKAVGCYLAFVSVVIGHKMLR
jgi:hypothetical protein